MEERHPLSVLNAVVFDALEVQDGSSSAKTGDRVSRPGVATSHGKHALHTEWQLAKTYVF